MESSEKILYLDAGAGISGDMTVAALLDLGADRKVLEDALASIPAEGFQTKISRVKKAGIDCCDFSVILDEAHENHDHDMEYLYGHEHHHDPEHHHDHEHDHMHGHDHHHHHEHRNYQDVKDILTKVNMTPAAHELALRIFSFVAEAEAKAHGIAADQVHFHEVGAIDSIVDVVSAAVCFDNLGIREVIIPSLGEGTGTVRCQHGILPVPVPATQNIMEAAGLHFTRIDERGEFITPTGAAIAAALITSDRLPGRYRVLRTGIGAGKRAYEHTNVLRAMLIQPEEEENPADSRRIWKLESNIDDSTGEQLGFVMDELLRAGARDVHYIPVFMKKNRPAYLLNVICTEGDIPEMERIIFRHTTSIGIRRTAMERTVLDRENIRVQFGLGEADVKVCTFEGKRMYYPEYESVIRIAREREMAFGDVYEAILGFCTERLR